MSKEGKKFCENPTHSSRVPQSIKFRLSLSWKEQKNRNTHTMWWCAGKSKNKILSFLMHEILKRRRVRKHPTTPTSRESKISTFKNVLLHKRVRKYPTTQTSYSQICQHLGKKHDHYGKTEISDNLSDPHVSCGQSQSAATGHRPSIPGVTSPLPSPFLSLQRLPFSVKPFYSRLA